MTPPAQQGSLPVELHELVLTHLHSEIDALLALRGANKAFRALYTPAAFRTVHINGSVVGASKLGRLFGMPEIVQYVKHLEFRTVAEDLYMYETVDEEMRTAFSRVWPLLSTLHRVTSATIILNEFGTCIERQGLFLVGLSHLPSGSLQSLTITNFSPYKHLVFMRRYRLCVLQSLRSVQSLSLSVTPYRAEDREEIITYRPIWASKQLFSSMPDLKSLSIHSPRPIAGGAAFCTHFPHLESLSLEGFMLGDETALLADDNANWTSAQKFLDMHCGTLKSLKLMNCAVLARVVEMGYRSPIPTAAATWMRLSENMRSLKEIEVTFDAKRREAWQWRKESMGRWKGYYAGTTRSAGSWFWSSLGKTGIIKAPFRLKIRSRTLRMTIVSLKNSSSAFEREYQSMIRGEGTGGTFCRNLGFQVALPYPCGGEAVSSIVALVLE